MTDRTVFHVPEGDEAYARRAFANASNLLADDTVAVEVAIVANGDGVAHLRADASSADRVRALLDAGVEVCACGNTIRKRDALDEADLLDGVTVVSSGMGELTRRQADGYGYVRP
jgi:intracellular sulfur oxidation DsrE/DsrF family protein